MALSIAEMRASNETGLPEASVRICLSQKLVRQIQELEDEKAALAPATGEDGKPSKPGRVGDPNTARVAEIDAELETLVEKMRDHTGDLTLRAVSAGEWRRWADAHPARLSPQSEEGAPVAIDQVDQDAAFGIVNGTDLLASLGTYAVAWNGEPITPADWEFIAQNAAPGDLKQTCRQVVRLHEKVGLVPKLLTPSSATQSDATD